MLLGTARLLFLCAWMGLVNMACITSTVVLAVNTGGRLLKKLMMGLLIAM